MTFLQFFVTERGKLMKHMRMPRGSKLDRLIRFPVEYRYFSLRIEAEERFPELLEALWELPESEIRDVRIARILMRSGHGGVASALELVGRWKNSYIARVQYMGMKLKNADEETTRKMVEAYRKRTTFGGSILNIEANMHEMLDVAIAAHRIGRLKLADQLYFEALEIAKTLKDEHTPKIIRYQMALMRLWNNHLPEARSTFEQVMRENNPAMTMYQYSLEYITWICWINDDRRQYLPRWAVAALDAASSLQELPEGIDPPKNAGIPELLPIMATLKTLTHEFNVQLPVLQQRDPKRIRDELVARIRGMVDLNETEMHGFVKRAMLALAQSMQHKTEALQILKQGFVWPHTGVAAMGMLYYATLVQISANLPHVDMDTHEIRLALKVLGDQYQYLPEGQQRWLMRWMREFCPVTLYILSEQVWKAFPPLHDYVVVREEGAYRGVDAVEKYPKSFMVRHVTELLQGWKPGRAQRMEAWRAVKAVRAIGSPMVIYTPVVDRLTKNLN